MKEQETMLTVKKIYETADVAYNLKEEQHQRCRRAARHGDAEAKETLSQVRQEASKLMDERQDALDAYMIACGAYDRAKKS